MSTQRISAVVALAVACVATGCSFLEAFEIVYGGSGKYRLDPIKAELLIPDVESLANLSSEELAHGVAGLPESKADVTLAHLRGALRFAGECSVTGKASQSIAGGKVDPERTTFTVTDCAGDERCAGRCPEGMRGLALEATIHLRFVSEKKAQDIKKNLADVSVSAINQFRLQFRDLTAFRRVAAEDGATSDEVITDALASFALSVGDRTGRREQVLDGTYLDRISPQTPQRFDLPVDSPVVHGIAVDLLEGKEIWLDLVLATFVPEDDLYRVPIENAGLRVDAQPELVVSALDTIESQL